MSTKEAKRIAQQNIRTNKNLTRFSDIKSTIKISFNTKHQQQKFEDIISTPFIISTKRRSRIKIITWGIVRRKNGNFLKSKTLKRIYSK